MTKFFKRCDCYLMTYVFQRVAWYVDARWHRNQFVLASVCIVLAMLVLAGQAVLDLLFGAIWTKVIVVPLLGVNVWLYQGWLNRFVAAAKWQEDNLGKLALPHHSFVLYPGEIRFTQILFCTFLLSILIVPAWQLGDLAVMCPGVWLLLISFSMCFAGVLPPSPGARVAKKEKAPAGLAPALSRI